VGNPSMREKPSPIFADSTAGPDVRLWCAVLASLLSDARCYWQSTHGHGIAADDYRLEQAFDDVMRCGPMLRHVCNNSGHDAAWISEGFARWCERDGL